MKPSNSAFKNSLQCLQNPFAILSIFILLINDHFLKAFFPSWVTGKLSDLAGLFFFPFIVTAVLGVLLKRTKLCSKQIGVISFISVAAWFATLKTVPVVNTLNSQIFSAMLGEPVKFALDPTDLIALTALYPAWKLWEKNKDFQPRRVAYLALSVGVLASIATSPVYITVRNVTDLVLSSDGTVYALDKKDSGSGRTSYAASHDKGLTWEQTYVDDGDVVVDEEIYPIDICFADTYQTTYSSYGICYRVTPGNQFQVAYLHGNDLIDHWGPVFSSGDLKVKAYDMILIKDTDEQILLVAVGKAGVLRRVIPDGNWELIKVLYAGGNDLPDQ